MSINKKSPEQEKAFDNLYNLIWHRITHDVKYLESNPEIYDHNSPIDEDVLRNLDGFGEYSGLHILSKLGTNYYLIFKPLQFNYLI